jgi:hypothetical protein
LKLPFLLTRFLYQNKKLNLPGIGSFILDPAAVLPSEHDKDLHTLASGIKFKNANIEEPDDDLIQFIKVHTGKMKSLAVADLHSFLTLGKELVNIGKPFFLEGIGTLNKNKEGGFDFIPGEYSAIPLEDGDSPRPARMEKKKHLLKEKEYEYEPRTNRVKNILLILAVIVGLTVIGLGAYILYKKNERQEKENKTVITAKESESVLTDSNQKSTLSNPDSSRPNRVEVKLPSPLSKDSILYKFIILETYNKFYALKRYNQLLSYNLKINLYTKDSSFFKVYFAFPARSKDTLYIKDSLNSVYAHKVIIER